MKNALWLALLISLFSCSPKTRHYQVIDFRKEESPLAYKIFMKVALEKAVSKREQEEYLRHLYDSLKSNNQGATQIYIYLYSSINKANSASGPTFDVMISSTTLSNGKPEIEYNSGSSESTQSEDQEYYEDIKKQMSEKGISICDFWYEWERITKQAWSNSSLYGEKWEIEKHNELVAKYNLSENLAGHAIMVGQKTCK